MTVAVDMDTESTEPKPRINYAACVILSKTHVIFWIPNNNILQSADTVLSCQRYFELELHA